MTDTPGWTPPTDPGASENTPAARPRGPQGPPPGAGYPPQPPGAPYPPQPPPGAPPGWGAPSPGAPYGTAPPGSFGRPGYGADGPQAGYGPQPGYGGPQAGYGAQGQPGGWGAPPGWGRPAAPEPGIVPLRPLGLSEILDGGFAIVRQYPKVTLGLSAIVVGTTQLLAFAAQVPDALEQGYTDPDLFGGITVAQVLSWVLSGIGIVMLAGMLTSVMGDAVLGRATTIGETWAKIRPRFWALLGAGILGTVVPYLGLVACLIPGLFLWGAWAFVTPIVVLEKAGVTQSIRRSWRLAVPDFWRVWGIRALAQLIASVIQWIILAPVMFLAIGSMVANESADLGLFQLTLITLGGIVGGTITAPFTSGCLALLYIDRRMRAEALDVTLAQVAQQQQAGTA